ncbi:DsbA family protein [Bradyrhizobium sp. KB893862 SZCCT0404]|uniref:DsbA family protein n=1 Tax=Bradyrhizobium sp. KB893862 SZCCT0404 TaxID=2807672 RepID=UPI001BA91120|nr:DsbA family protein [Bradyrhizobium sp. KB893862 SZCCT0404]MBR1175251.1 DsbA family protein [Bradyrhizobium sp. KB893862 SZCCT0404]
MTRLLRICLFITLASSATYHPVRVFAESASEPALPRADVEAIVHDYILAHPEVLIDSLKSAKQRQADQAATVAKSFISANRSQIFDDPQSPVFGNVMGNVTIVEFFDYRCPYCRQADPLLKKLISEDAKIRIVQKQLPILGPASMVAARAALAANKQNKFVVLHDALMARNFNSDEDGILKLADSLGLDIVRLKADMASPQVNAEIANNIRLARDLGLDGTPAFIVGSELLPGATDLATLKSMVIDARREQN